MLLFNDSFSIIYAKAFAAFEIKNFDQCEMFVGQGLALQPENTDLLSLGGQVKIRKSEYDFARLGAHRIIELAPEDDRGYSLLAWATILDDQYCPENAGFDPSLDDGRAAWKLRLETAETLNQRCLELDPVDPRHWSLKSKLHLLRKEGHESLKAAESGLRLSPNDSDLHHCRILAFENIGNTDAMYVALHEQLKRSPEDDTAHSKLAQVYLSRKQVDKAITHAREAIRIAPDDDENKDIYWDAVMASNGFIRPFVYCRYAVCWIKELPPWAHVVSGISLGILLGLGMAIAQKLGDPWEWIVVCAYIVAAVISPIVLSERPFMAVFDLYFYFRDPTFRVTTSDEKRNETLVIIGLFGTAIVFLASLALQFYLPIALMILAFPIASIYFAKSTKIRLIAIAMTVLTSVLLCFGLSTFASSNVGTIERVYSAWFLIAFVIFSVATAAVTQVLNAKEH